MSEGPIKPKKAMEGIEEKQVGPMGEKLLSPEVVEKILEKVQDIDTAGLAYSRIPTEITKEILQEGLLGADFRISGGSFVGHEGTFKTSRTS